MKHQYYDDNGTLHILDGCTPEEHIKWQQDIQRYSDAAKNTETRHRGLHGGAMHWCTEKQMKDAIERTKRSKHGAGNCRQIWDYLTEPRISFLAMMVGVSASHLLIQLLVWGLR